MELREAIAALDLKQDKMCMEDNLSFVVKSRTQYHRAMPEYGGRGGYEIVYTHIGTRPETDYNMSKWPQSLRQKLIGCPLRMPKKQVDLRARVNIINLTDAKVKMKRRQER